MQRSSLSAEEKQTNYCTNRGCRHKSEEGSKINFSLLGAGFHLKGEHKGDLHVLKKKKKI